MHSGSNNIRTHCMHVLHAEICGQSCSREKSLVPICNTLAYHKGKGYTKLGEKNSFEKKNYTGFKLLPRESSIE